MSYQRPNARLNPAPRTVRADGSRGTSAQAFWFVGYILSRWPTYISDSTPALGPRASPFIDVDVKSAQVVSAYGFDHPLVS